jgi:hypothetical protein
MRAALVLGVLALVGCDDCPLPKRPTLVSSIYEPHNIGAGGGAVYVTAVHAISHVPPCGDLEAYLGGSMWGVRADASAIYWIGDTVIPITSPDLSIWIWRSNAGMPYTLVRTNGALVFAIDDDSIYWLEDAGGGGSPASRLMRLPKAGGAATELATLSISPQAAVEAGGGAVYLNDQHVILSVPKTGGPGTMVASHENFPTSRIAAGTQSLYWTDTAGIYRLPFGGASQPSLVVADPNPQALGVDVDTPYWTNSVGLMKLARGAPVVVAPGVTNVGGMAVAGDRIYWFTPPYVAGCQTVLGAVWKAPK